MPHAAAKLVDELKAKAREQQAQLQLKQQEADRALVDITESMQRASMQKSEVERVKTELGAQGGHCCRQTHSRAGVEEKKLNQRKKAIEVELSSVQPLVDAARAAVGGISQESLSYIRSLKAPPDTIRVILMVCARGLSCGDSI